MWKWAVAAFVAIGFAWSQVSGAYAAEPAGMVERLRGTASATSPDGTVSTLAEGSGILVDDVVETAPGARLLIRMRDQSSLRLSGGARIVIDAFTLPEDEAGLSAITQVIDIAQGVFEFTSGAIGDLAPQRITLRTPVATIGVRGTQLVGGELTVGMPPGVPHYGFQVRDGRVAILAPGGSVELNLPGEGTFLPLDRIAAPTPVRQWTPAEAGEADALLAF